MRVVRCEGRVAASDAIYRGTRQERPKRTDYSYRRSGSRLLHNSLRN